MGNLELWGEAVNLIEDISRTESDDSLLSADERIASFVEKYRDRFDPAYDFEEYVLVRFARAVAKLRQVNNTESIT